MPNAINSAGLFLITTLFDLYIFVVLARILLVAVKADYFNPMSQFVIKLTQFIITPMRRVIPNFRQIELASVVLVILLEMLKFFLISMILITTPNMIGLIVLGLADALKAMLNIFFYAILLQAILTWVQTGYSPVAYLLSQITAPLMRPFRRIIPPINGVDISPLPAMIVLQLLIILIVGPLFVVGQVMAFG